MSKDANDKKTKWWSEEINSSFRAYLEKESKEKEELTGLRPYISSGYTLPTNWIYTHNTMPVSVKGNDNMSVKAKNKYDPVKNFVPADKELEDKILEEVNKKPEVISFMGKTYEINKDEFITDNYIFNPEHIPTIRFILKSIEEGNRVNIKAVGEAGTGKTSFMQALGEYFNFPTYYMNCSVNTNPNMWFGQRTIEEGKGTNFVKTQFANFIESQKGAVILDEFNRPDPEDLNTLFPLLDNTGRFDLPEATIFRNAHCVFYAPVNEGWEYVGTNKLDKAMNDRFHVYLNFNSLSKDREIEILKKKGLDEKEASLIVSNLQKIRSIVYSDQFDAEVPFSLSIRKSIMIGMLVESGFTIKEAITHAIINGLNENDRTAFQNIVNGL